MDKDEFPQYLTQESDLLQRKAIELQEQHDEIEKQVLMAMTNATTYPFIQLEGSGRIGFLAVIIE
jgi:hypothetical protein